jgi:twitching motility protein PilT
VPDIKFQCPHCQAGLEVDESLAGQTAECPACSKSVQIPAPEAVAPFRRTIAEVLAKAVALGASDVHLVIGKTPMGRIRGEIRPLDDAFGVLSAEDSQRLIYEMLQDDQRRRLEEHWELDFSFTVPEVSRFRVNVLKQRTGIEAVFRIISAKIPKPEQIALTPSIMAFADLPRGLVLVTGPTGSGKSTTLACILNLINETRPDHILTVEDPIEFVYESKQAIVRQREVGQQTKSFQEAIKHALRQDPDVILVGEMRDLETISLALTAAETGHLVFGTLHTTDAPQTVDRVIDVFPSHQQQQVRVQLSSVLKGVVCQTLLPTKDGKGRVAAREVMLVTPAISNLIREGKTHQIYSAIDTGQKFGMVSLDKSLLELVRQGRVTKEDAVAVAHDPAVILAAT